MECYCTGKYREVCQDSSVTWLSHVKIAASLGYAMLLQIYYRSNTVDFFPSNFKELNILKQQRHTKLHTHTNYILNKFYG